MFFGNFLSLGDKEWNNMTEKGFFHDKGWIRIALILALVFVNIGCDQVSKSIARENLEYHERIEVLGDFLILTKVENEGAFLSLGSSLAPRTRKILLAILPSLVLLFFLGMVIRTKSLSALSLFGFCWVIGGGVGNVIDRIAYGSVTDFAHMGLFGLRTGIFNMADVSIMVGIGLILFESIRDKFKKTDPPAEAPSV